MQFFQDKQCPLTLIKQIQLTENSTTIQFNKTRNILNVGFQNGTIRLYTMPKMQLYLQFHEYQYSSPVTSLCSCESGTTKNLILAGFASGNSMLWHSSSKKILVQQKLQQQVYTVALNHLTMAIAGYSGTIFISPISKKQFRPLPTQYKNRVYKLLFDQQYPNLLYSGGWDSLIICWDINTNNKVWSFYGITITGNSLSIKKNILLAGNDSQQKRIVLIDKMTGNQLKIINWSEMHPGVRVKNCLYGSQRSQMIVGTLSGKHELRIYDGNLQKCIGSWMSQSCIKQLEVDRLNNNIMIATQNKKLILFQFK